MPGHGYYVNDRKMLRVKKGRAGKTDINHIQRSNPPPASLVQHKTLLTGRFIKSWTVYCKQAGITSSIS